MKVKAYQIVVKLRALQMGYIHTHHQVVGCSFFSDHGAAANFYDAVQLDADAASERLIGLFGADVLSLNYWGEAADLVMVLPDKGNAELWSAMLAMEKELIVSLEDLCKDLPREADRQLYSGIADKAVARTYQLKQRLKGD
jgi:DNA-binding ferritin-like protein